MVDLDFSHSGKLAQGGGGIAVVGASACGSAGAGVADGLDLSNFPTLEEAQRSGEIGNGSNGPAKASAWNLLDQSLPFFPPTAEKNGRTLVQPPQAVLIDGAKQWDNALIGNFFGKSPPLGVFQKTADRLWGREGSVVIRFLAPSVYMVNFPSQRVRDWVLESGPWHIQQKAIIPRKWSPGLLPEVLSLDSVHVWVRLWHVPLELYSQQGLGYLASALGKPLYTDKATVLKQQLEFAKVCVNVDAKTVLPSSILVDLGNDNLVNVTVELVWSPPRCGHCCIFGHLEEKCMKKGGESLTIIAENHEDVQVAPADNIVGQDVALVTSDVGLSVDPIPVDSIVDGISSDVVEPVAVLDSINNNGIRSDVVPVVIGVDVTVGSSASVPNPNHFDVLGDELEDKVSSPRKERVAELMNMLKPKAKGQKQNNKKKGKGGQKGGFSPG